MDHRERTRAEFTRQAAHFAASPAVNDDRLTGRILAAVGPNGKGDVLDLACGPGILTAALARTAGSVVAFDLTAAMLRMAEERCSAAGLANVSYRQGDAENLPFADGAFDCVVTRLSIHHFADPARVLAEVRRVLRPVGTLVVADIVSSEVPAESALHNAIEIIRDPSHVRMVPASELVALIEAAGFGVTRRSTWDQKRQFEEWARTVDDPQRVAPLRTIVRALAGAGLTAGTELSLAGHDIGFTHRWLLIAAQPRRADQH